MDEIPRKNLPSKLRRNLKWIFDRPGNEKLKENFLRAVPFWIASLLTGLIAGGLLSVMKNSRAEAVFRKSWQRSNWPARGTIIRPADCSVSG
jgi:hypothetical protein